MICLNCAHTAHTKRCVEATHYDERFGVEYCGCYDEAAISEPEIDSEIGDEIEMVYGFGMAVTE